MKKSSISPDHEDPATAESSANPFPYRDYVEALRAFQAAAKKGPFYGSVTGATGTGKTSLMRELSQTLDPHRHRVVYLAASKVSLLGIARYLALSVHIAPKRSSLETCQLVTAALRGQSTQVVAWIDEAHRLEPETMLEVVTLAEFDRDSMQTFSVIFSGPLDLSRALDDRRLFPLRRRISARYVLTGLSRDELDPFLLHRFGAEQAKRIDEGLRDEVFEHTRGAPALIDSVLRRIFETTAEGNIGESHLREAFDVIGV